MLAIAAGTPRIDIAKRFNVSAGFISQVASEYGLSRKSKRTSFVRKDSDGVYLYVGATLVSIDEEDAERVAERPWSLDPRGYVVSTKLAKLHRWLIDAAPGEIVDHIDGNIHNNLKENLRIVTHTESGQNRHRFATSPTIFKGLSQYGERWISRIQVSGRAIHLGVFSNPVNAAHAYDAAARRYFGEYARLNFPETGEQSAVFGHEAAELDRLIRGAA